MVTVEIQNCCLKYKNTDTRFSIEGKPLTQIIFIGLHTQKSRKLNLLEFSIDQSFETA